MRSLILACVLIHFSHAIGLADDQSPAANSVSGPRIVTVDDILLIESLVDGLNTRRSVVEPDGNLALGPRWGRIKVAGKDILEIERLVREHIAKHVQQPELQITYAGHSSDGSPGMQPDVGEVIVKLKQVERDIAEFKALVRELRQLKPR